MTMVAPTTTTMGPEETTALPVEKSDFTVTAVVIVLLLLTLLALGFLLYRYLCKNKGAYETAGEPGPGHHMDLQSQLEPDQDQDQKKEYYI
ncbi:Small cell adhesion glycoprotein [Acipenser ruthenus]|uniref:Small cell adhesion glycoprotein n=1 Tax=Acipenser ruthenus TaxID=7906 RepID=A0A444UTT3_ACIRT|nr:Small cell adhesion glycoprotein [Acipenser ruthenus]